MTFEAYIHTQDLGPLLVEITRLDGARNAIAPRVAAAQANLDAVDLPGHVQRYFAAHDTWLNAVHARHREGPNAAAAEKTAMDAAKAAMDIAYRDNARYRPERDNLVATRAALDAQYALTTEVFGSKF